MEAISAYQIGDDFLCHVDYWKGKSMTITTEYEDLVLTPGDQPTNQIVLNDADNFFILKHSTDKQIKANGEKVLFEVKPALEATTLLEKWKEKLCGEVTDAFENKKEYRLEENFAEMFEKIDLSQDSEKLLKAKTTNQRASYLRTLGTSSSDRRLRCRYKRCNLIQPDEMMENIKKLKDILHTLKSAKEIPEAPRCNYSQETSLESAISAIEVGIEQFNNFDDLNLDQCLRLFGLLGVPIHHKIGNYADPMNLGVNQGDGNSLSHIETISNIDDTIVLNQSSLVHLSKIRNPFKTLGFKDEITAVVPIQSWNHPEVWKAYNSFTEIARLQASVQIRRTMMPIPEDLKALSASTLLKMMRIWGNPNKHQAKLMSQLFNSLQNESQSTERSEKFLKHMQGQGEDLYITKNFPSSLGPFALLLSTENFFQFAGSEGSALFWQAIVSNTIHWRVHQIMGKQDRHDILKQIYKILGGEQSIPKGKSLNLNIEAAFDYAKKQKFIEDPILFQRVYALAKSSKEKVTPQSFGQELVSFETFNNFVININYKLFMVVEVVKSLLCKGMKERLYGKSKMKYPHHSTEEDAMSWLKERIKQNNRQKRELIMTQKKKKDEMVLFINNVSTLSSESFAQGLNDFDLWNKTDKLFHILSKLEILEVASYADKLRLLLHGKMNRKGQTIQNSSIRTVLIHKLKTISTAEELEDIKKFDELCGFAKHIYREVTDSNGKELTSRKKYCNKKPSFWAVTGFSEPWDFYKNDQLGYKNFVESLASYEFGNDAQKDFFARWKHLQDFLPSKYRTSGFGSMVKYVPEASPYEVFCNPKDPTYGYDQFWSYLISIDPNASPYFAKNINVKFLSKKWKTLLEKLLPEEADEVIHSIQEVFGVKDIHHKLFTTFSVLKKSLSLGSLSITQLKENLYPILEKARKSSDEDIYQDEDIMIIDTFKGYLIDDILLKYHSVLIKKLLPSLAIPITRAMEKLYDTNEKKAMVAEHILNRFVLLQYTSLEAIKEAKEAISQCRSITQKNLAFSNAYTPVYDVIIDKPLPETQEEWGTFKNEIEKTLSSIKTNQRLRDWLIKVHDQRCTSYGWQKINGSLKEEDFKSVSYEIFDVFYGGKVHIAFKFLCFHVEGGNENENIRSRLEKLNNLYRIALEHIDDIIPNSRPIQVKNKTIYISRTSENDPDVESILIDSFRDIWGKAFRDEAYRKKLLEKLNKKHPTLAFNTTEDILALFNNEHYRDMDNLKIQVQKDPVRNNVNMVNGFVLWPKETRRLNELPDEWFGKLHDIIVRSIPEKFYYTTGKRFIISAALYKEDPNGMKLRREVMKISKKSNSESSDILFEILDHFRTNGGTVGDLCLALKECLTNDVNLTVEENKEKIPYIESVIQLIDTLITETYKSWKAIFEMPLPGKITHRKEFENFFKHYGLSQMPKMNVSEFNQKLESGEVKNGDQIWFWRYRAVTNYYAHVGILVDEQTIGQSIFGHEQHPPQKHVVHVTPRERIAVKKLNKNETGKISCQPVKKVLLANDLLFVVRYGDGDEYCGSDIARRALACCSPKLTFFYNGYFGSCETFASKVCGTTSIQGLNLQGFRVACEGGKKKFIANRLHEEHNYDDLIEKIDNRMHQMGQQTPMQVADLQNNN